MLPSALCFTQKTHLELTIFLSDGRGSVTQVPAFSRVANSRSIASFQRGQSERDCACASILGSASASCMAAEMTSSTSALKTLSENSSPVVPSPASSLLLYSDSGGKRFDL